MSPSVVGIFVGLFLGWALAAEGFGDMLIVALGGILGWLVAKVIEGEIDPSDYIGRAKRS